MTAKPKLIGFGFAPAGSEHHFLVTLPSAPSESVYMSEHLHWDNSDARRELSVALGAEDNAIRVILPRPPSGTPSRMPFSTKSTPKSNMRSKPSSTRCWR